MFVMYSRTDVLSTEISSLRSNRLALQDTEHRLQILQQLRTMLMFVAYDSLTTNMASAALTTDSIVANDVIVDVCITGSNNN